MTIDVEKIDWGQKEWLDSDTVPEVIQLARKAAEDLRTAALLLDGLFYHEDTDTMDQALSVVITLADQHVISAYAQLRRAQISNNECLYRG